MNYHNIVHEDMNNGDGLRTTMFCAGCTHGCPGCHNPETWDKDGGILFDEAAKQELFDSLEDKYISGVTFSGGDPLAPFNREETLALAKEIKEKFPDKTVWIYTGFTREALENQGFWKEIKPYVDVLVDGPFLQAKKDVSYEWAGSTNQRVLRKESDFMVNTSDKSIDPFIPQKCSCGDNDLGLEDYER